MTSGVSRRSLAPIPPEKGSFPLDHEGECKSFMIDFLNCLKENRGSHGRCKSLSKSYLTCRMERGLMKPEPFEQLGFVEKDDDDNSNRQTYDQNDRSIRSKDRKENKEESDEQDRDKRGTYISCH